MRISEVRLFDVRLPLVRPFETSFGRIDAREFVLVAVDAAGATGWGECVADVDPFYSEETTTTAWYVMTKVLVPAILGQTLAHPRDVAEKWARVRGHRMAKAALEMAIWDLRARLDGRPLCELLGAAARPIPAGVSIGIQPSLEALVDRVGSELADGYRRIKIKIKPGWDRGPVEAIRARFDTVPLMVDANAAYTAASAGALGSLDAFDLMMIEQPLDYDDLVDHARLQASLRTPDLPRRVDHRPEGGNRRARARRVPDHQHQAGPDGRVRAVASKFTTSPARAAFRCGMAVCSKAASAARTICISPRCPALRCRATSRRVVATSCPI